MAAKKKTAKKKQASKKKVVKKKAVAKKKAVSKKKSSKKKVVAKKKASKKKTAAKKVNKKSGAKKKVAKKKVAPKKKLAKKKAVKKKTRSDKGSMSKKKISKKTTTKKTAKKNTRKVDGPSSDFVPYKRKKNEDYMNAAQSEHFKQILTDWKQELLEEVERTVDHMKEDASNFPDPADRASQEEEFGLELRTRDRERKLLRKINEALNRIEEGEYGYCEETGEEIGLKRLEARPVATLCLEAQERRELRKKQFRDHDDRVR